MTFIEKITIPLPCLLLFVLQNKMSILSQYKVKVMNIGLTKSAIILADSFVDFKRKAASQLCLSGWLEVRVYKAEDFEVREAFKTSTAKFL